jgi:hypothetical protein
VIEGLRAKQGVIDMKRLVTRLLMLALLCQMILGLPFIVQKVSAMDRVRVESRIDEAVTRFGTTGRGVIAATIDR